MEKNTEIFQYTTDDFHSDGNDILVLGIGNYLMGDEGIGVQFIQNLDTAKFPQNISFLDGGTGGFTLIPYIESHQKVIIVDATMDGKEEGLECKDWFFCTKKISKETVLDRILKK